ncbi:uncharacterized protein EKO05_0003977 [Ascochyta rabiei]|uniref:uncharacterized protein n=1 Tax=Didymella rabiei TaxID=5454 RepID=UPI0021FD339A|nr:uncharacterized protein EKO05_0003977 [Ascochyta rabiei]UPX13470.1 hypothetical protein EKO05_0003977 [Ascochyta rabiei]
MMYWLARLFRSVEPHTLNCTLKLTLNYTINYTINYTVNYTVNYTMPAQRSRSRIGFKNVESGWTQLMETFTSIELSLRLTKGQVGRIKKMTEDKKTKKSGAFLKQHKFLRRVLAINPDSYTLCIVAFSQNQIDSTKAAILDGLVERIKERRDDTIMSPTMRSLFDHSEDNRIVPLLQETHKLSTNPSEPWVELKYAERAGTREVFGQYLVDRIENTELSDNWKAVIMRLPVWPPDLSAPCFMSLDLREESIKEVAMALFKVEVTWVTDAFWVVHCGGMSQIIPYFQHTMKGVSDEDIVAVFGADGERVKRRSSKNKMCINDLFKEEGHDRPNIERNGGC